MKSDNVNRALARRVLAVLCLLSICAAAQPVQQPLAQFPAKAAEPPAISKEIAPAPAAKSLQPYGYSFFQATGPSTTPTATAGAMTQDYLLGPGDQLLIHLGGKVQENFEAAVSADGKLYVPTVGVLAVQGLTFNQLQKKLQERLQGLYANYTLDVMLAVPKLVRVGVTGEVREPGQYTVTALSSVLDAVAQAKGPTDIGSLRDIQVFRGDSLVLQVDLYEYLLKPGRGSYGQLQSGDQVFIPICKKRVRVIGEVYRPAIYEIHPSRPEKLSQMLTLAGGLTDYAFLDKVEFSRSNDNGVRHVSYVSIPTLQSEPDQDLLLENDDQIQVFSRLDQVPLTKVSIWGEVNHPGEYEFEKNVRVSDLILKAGYLTRSAFMLKAQVAKVDPLQPTRTIDVDLQSVLQNHDPSQDILLDADDQVFIRREPDWEVGPTVEIRGQVKFPGMYAMIKDSTTLYMVLQRAGGFTQNALIGEAKLIRRRELPVEDKEFERLKSMTRDQMSELEYEYLVMKQNSANVNEIVVDFDKLVNKGDRTQDVKLMDGDVIVIPETPRVVLVTGCVGKPGGVVYREGAEMSYYISQAGGYSWDADGRRAKVIKVTGEIKDDEDVDNFLPGDRIWVPRQAEHDYWQIFRDIMMVAGQVATMYLVIHTATK
jgi:protein involved in polysaccharide export with SLBB domain